ncbi:pectate lyase-like adhesive domain-containing protein [Xylocopilactobacillus apicola]|uniref:WxL domain-containing protein n=1 Tax=Xylocopilactobacillus apicola TaxID=2932184 RepID=A0AAU9DUG2_9LACO|nr:pectate lyase-like adhesive domain-containing protein [Xylocopilactobacillus apicola]BDR59123.1 hypothetical protein XA3_15640 [Xylocopilactobacillus apicola]
MFLLVFLTVIFSGLRVSASKTSNLSNISLMDLHPISVLAKDNSLNSKPDIYAPFYGNGFLPGIYGSATDDPRTQYDTPDPDDPENIKKFRVKTHPETDLQIKERLTKDDVYDQIQRYKSEGETAYVSTPDELLNALWGRRGAYKSTDPFPSFAPDGSGAIAQVNITHIVLTKDIVFTLATTVNGYQSFNNLVAYTNQYIPNRNIVIDGIDPRDPTKTKHTLDFNGSIDNSRIDLNSNYFKSKFVFNNINLQGTDYFGPGSAVGNPIDKTVIYRNIKYRGSQLAASYRTDIVFTGYNDVQSTISYQTLEPVSTTGATNSNGLIYDDARPGKMLYAFGHLPTNAPAGSSESYECQQIMESYNVTFALNTKFEGKTATTGAFVLGYYLSNGKPCNVNVMDHAEVNVESTNQGSRAEYSDYTATIQLWSGELEVHPHAVLNINAYEFQNTSPSGDTNPNNITHNPSYTRDLINLTPQGGFNPNVKVDDYATINGTQTGPIASAGLSRGAVSLGVGASLDVGKWAKFNIESTDAKVSIQPVLNMESGAKVSVAQPGTFNLEGDGDYTGARSLIQLGSTATFEFNRARMVNIQYKGTQPNTNLISMNPGQMHVENMDVYAWNRGNSAATGTHPDPYDNVEGKDFMWQSIFNFIANYNSAGFVNIDAAASSLFPNDIADMRINYNTNRFQRVMFHYIPTVYFMDFTSKPVDSPSSDVNSYQISGKVVTDNINDPEGDYVPMDGAYVRLSGHVKNTAAASEVGSVDLDQPFYNKIDPDPRWADISASGLDITSKFSAITKPDGTFTVLAGEPVIGIFETFMASDPSDPENTRPNENGRIQAFAFSRGNYNFANTEVLDKGKPRAQAAPLRYSVVDRPAPDPKYFVDTSVDPATGLTKISDLYPGINSNAFTKLSDYKFTFDSRNLATDTTFWGTPGNNKSVYVNVTDPSGNTTVVEGKVTISSLPVFIEVNKPNAVVKIPDGSASWTPAQWQNWVTTTNPNEARALKINSDGSTTDISSQMTNNANAFGQQVNNITYTVPTGAVPPAATTTTANATIELRSDTLQLKLPLDSNNLTAPISFGRYGSYNTGYLKSKDTTSYAGKILDDRVDKTHDWSLDIVASKFKETYPGVTELPIETIDLGLLQNTTNIFSDLISTADTIASGVGNHDFDVLTGAGLTDSNNKLTIYRPNNDSRLNGRSYSSKLTWTLIDTTP